jgi:hypothetical protein
MDYGPACKIVQRVDELIDSGKDSVLSLRDSDRRNELTIFAGLGTPSRKRFKPCKQFFSCSNIYLLLSSC